MSSKRVLFLGGRAHGERYRVGDTVGIYFVPNPAALAALMYGDGSGEVEATADEYERRMAYIGGRYIDVFALSGTTDREFDVLLATYLADVLEGKEVP